MPAVEEEPFPVKTRRARESSFDHRLSVEDLIKDLQEHQRSTAAQEVPWFITNMPADYFRVVDEDSQRQHIRALTALRSERLTVPEVMLASDTEDRYTFITSGKGDTTSTIRRQMESLPQSLSHRRVLLFTSADERLSLNIYEVSRADVDNERGDGLDRFKIGPSASEEEQEALQRVAEYAAQLPESSMRGGIAYSPPAFRNDIIQPPNSPNGALESTMITPMPPSPGKRLAQSERDLFMSRCSSAYVCSQLPRLLHLQSLLYKKVVGTEKVAVNIETAATGADWAANEGVQDGSCILITLALPGVSPRAALRRGLRLIELHSLDFIRAQVDTVDDPSSTGDGYVTLLRILGGLPDGTPELGAEQLGRLERDAMRIKWVDAPALRFAAQSCGKVTLLVGEVMIALADLALSVLNHPLLSRPHVHERLSYADVQPHAVSLAQLFLARFDPERPTEEEAFLEAVDGAVRTFELNVNDEESRQLLRAMASGVRCTFRTNAFIHSRWALTLRLDPNYFDGVLPPSPVATLSNRPFAVFFCSGRHFSGYHVRFSDIARGGLRLVLPPSVDAHTSESRRHFQECFSLAYAQQLKNKDIPEGGAKAVCLVHPVAGEERSRLLHGCVKKFTDGLLDLISPSGRSVVSRGAGASELLYLGPDENITPNDIDWIAHRAAERKYKMPSAFISSKPAAGINHKEYGVTSEGVAVFLDEGLRAIGIDPDKQSFTIKLTGGPDGDVAGNMLRILHREYGERARVVGLADGLGCVEDPDGLPIDELMRLVRASLPIASIDTSKLGPRGVLTLANTPAGAAARNSMHNRVLADAFVPAGGRPSTVNGSNWREFLRPDGTPSSRLVVEGANLFFTGEARAALFNSCGLPMIKDSSANKCGVICSSMEIVASMVCDGPQFVELKPKYVPQVLERLRELARLEAKMLFSEHGRQPTVSLPVISQRISASILRVGAELDAALDKLASDEQEALWPVVRSQLPPALFDAPFSPHVAERLPWPYKKSTISSGLSSRLVYREGLAFVEGLPQPQLAEFALNYLQQERRVRELAKQVAASGLPFSAEVEKLLLAGGVRAATEAVACVTKPLNSQL